MQMTASGLDRQLDALSESLGARPLDVPASQAVLVQTQAGCKATIAKMLAAREQLATSQVRGWLVIECCRLGRCKQAARPPLRRCWLCASQMQAGCKATIVQMLAARKPGGWLLIPAASGVVSGLYEASMAQMLAAHEQLAI
eukprot:1153623-Pelagomonas_calceolata.AAC.4